MPRGQSFVASRRADLQKYDVFNFRKGLDNKTSPLSLALQKDQTSLRRADNMVYLSDGGVTKRLDQAKLTTASVGASVAITGGVEFKKSNGDRIIIFGTNDGRLIRLNTDGTTTDQVTGLTTGTRWYFAVYNDLLIVGNRADAPRKFDGTTWSLLGGSPPTAGGPVVVHGNRVFWLDALQKSRVTWSALNNEEDYTSPSDAGSVLVSENDGSDCEALVPSINELVILKGKRPYRLQGTNPATFALTNLVPTTGSVGAISPQGALFAANDVWYLATAGVINLRTVLEFGDLKESFASDRIAAFFETGTDVTLTLQNLDNACSAYDPQNNRLCFALDSNGDDKNDFLILLDLHTKGWSVWTAQSIASMWQAYSTSSGLVELYAGGYDGHVRAFNRDISTNNIDGHVQHLSCLNAPGIEKSVRYGYFYFKEEGAVTVPITINYDFGATGGQVYNASLLGGSKTLGVNWVLGTDPLGAKQQIVKRLDIAGIGEYVEVSVREPTTKPYTLYGYQLMWRARRSVRRGTAAA